MHVRTRLKCTHTVCSQSNQKYIINATSKPLFVQRHFINKDEIAMKHLPVFAGKEL